MGKKAYSDDVRSSFFICGNGRNSYGFAESLYKVFGQAVNLLEVVVELWSHGSLEGVVSCLVVSTGALGTVGVIIYARRKFKRTAGTG